MPPVYKKIIEEKSKCNCCCVRGSNARVSDRSWEKIHKYICIRKKITFGALLSSFRVHSVHNASYYCPAFRSITFHPLDRFLRKLRSEQRDSENHFKSLISRLFETFGRREFKHELCKPWNEHEHSKDIDILVALMMKCCSPPLIAPKPSPNESSPAT